jgi:hypothetical protein
MYNRLRAAVNAGSIVPLAAKQYNEKLATVMIVFDNEDFFRHKEETFR